MALSEFPRLGFDPFVELRRMQSEINRLFSGYDPRTRDFPPINIWLGDNSVVVTSEAAGAAYTASITAPSGIWSMTLPGKSWPCSRSLRLPGPRLRKWDWRDLAPNPLGESSDALLRQFGPGANKSPRALDFGDSYVDVVLPRELIGGVPMVVFFQMDKVSHGLKRIQLERPRHAVNPPAFRGVLAGLHTDFGSPDRCAPSRDSRERVSGRGRGAVASGRRRRQCDLPRHDPPSLRGLPVRPSFRLVRANRSAFRADRSVCG